MVDHRAPVKVKAAIAAIGDKAWQTIAYTAGGEAQVAETTYTTGERANEREVRLVVRRTRLTDSAQRRLWPDWRYHAFITDRDDLDTVAADAFHRQTPQSSSHRESSKTAPGSPTSPRGTTAPTAPGSPAPCSPTTSAHGPACSPTRPPAPRAPDWTRLFALPAVLVNRSGRPTLRFAPHWPWAHQFHTTLKALRGRRAPQAEPAPPGAPRTPQQPQRHQPDPPPPPPDAPRHAPTRPNPATRLHTTPNPHRQRRTPRHRPQKRWIQA